MTVLDFSPSEVDLILYQGDDWSKTFRLGSRPSEEADIVYWDLTGWSGQSQFRAKAKSEEVLVSLDIVFGEDQDTDSGAGYFTVSMDAEDSSVLPKRCVWDIELVDSSGFKRTFISGSVDVVREVTRGA